MRRSLINSVTQNNSCRGPSNNEGAAFIIKQQGRQSLPKEAVNNGCQKSMKARPSPMWTNCVQH